MIPNRLLLSALCLATLLFPQALRSQTHLAVESIALSMHSRTADFNLILQSKDLEWKAAGDSKSKADLILTAASIDKRGDVLVWGREYLTITVDTEDPAKLPMANARFSSKVKIPSDTNKVRFLIQSADEREIGSIEVDRKTIYAASEREPTPVLPCRNRGWCWP
ncbi:MAG: hypothetical protein WA510_30805 [Acidobacteriaceae bacterium]